MLKFLLDLIKMFFKTKSQKPNEIVTEETPEAIEKSEEKPVYKYGSASLRRIAECHPDLQIIAHELIKVMDVSVICGYRGEKEQNEAFDKGFSRLRYPQGKHNQKPSLAIDIVPYPVNWNDIDRFEIMCSEVERIAKERGIKIRLGRDFKTLKDYPHIELV